MKHFDRAPRRLSAARRRADDVRRSIASMGRLHFPFLSLTGGFTTFSFKINQLSCNYSEQKYSSELMYLDYTLKRTHTHTHARIFYFYTLVSAKMSFAAFG